MKRLALHYLLAFAVSGAALMLLTPESADSRPAEGDRTASPRAGVPPRIATPHRGPGFTPDPVPPVCAPGYTPYLAAPGEQADHYCAHRIESPRCRTGWKVSKVAIRIRNGQLVAEYGCYDPTPKPGQLFPRR